MISVKTYFSIHDINAEAWDQVSGGMPFQSHRWYIFGEQVMSDCRPIYLLAYVDDRLVARTSLWLIRNEPVPKMPEPLRTTIVRITKRWPLLICRSPLSSTSGFVITDLSKLPEVVASFAKQTLTIAREHRASFVLFDYLSKAQAQAWSEHFLVTTSSEPGMSMENRWSSLEDYLSAAGKKDRQHYKRVLREAQRFRIQIEHHRSTENLEDALRLIQEVERRHGALPNPWTQGMLEHMELINGEFLTATIDNRLVGCGLLLEDNSAQMTTALGLEEDVPYVYFMLIYESLRVAFEHKIRLLRWGSGAYDVKQRLGFSAEDNSSLAFTAVHPYLQKVLHTLVR